MNTIYYNKGILLRGWHLYVWKKKSSITLTIYHIPLILQIPLATYHLPHIWFTLVIVFLLCPSWSFTWCFNTIFYFFRLIIVVHLIIDPQCKGALGNCLIHLRSTLLSTCLLLGHGIHLTLFPMDASHHCRKRHWSTPIVAIFLFITINCVF